MNFGEELRFLGGLYNTIKDRYPETEVENIFKQKAVVVAVNKDIVSLKTANQIAKIIFQYNQEQDVESLIESIMDDDINKAFNKNKIDLQTVGDDLSRIGKLYTSLEEEKENNSALMSQVSFNKMFSEKVNRLVDKKVVSSIVADAIIKIIDDKEIDNLIDTVMKEPVKQVRARTQSYDPCGHSSIGRSPC